MADLSVITVNYNSGWFCSNLVDSLLDQEFESMTGAPGEIEIIVLDNASPDDQHHMLDPLKQKGVKVVYSDRNTGYSGGNNEGMEHVTSDWVMICNPDVVLMPDSIRMMLNALYSDSSAGMAGPRGWLDPGFHFLLPPVESVRLSSHLFECAGRVFKSIGRSYSLHRSRNALPFWSGGTLQESGMISGYCFIMQTALARRLGPFDTGFPFYYEDNDICLRLRRAGSKLLFVKGTRVIHFYNKSAGPVFDEVLEKYYRSKSYFFKKHYGALRHFIYRKSAEYIKKNIDKLKGYEYERPHDLGELSTPPVLEVPGKRRPNVVEITLDPAFVLAAGRIHDEEVYKMPDLTWSALDANTWYLRILDEKCRKILGSWKWKKTAPAVLPPAYGELKEMMQ